MAAFRTTRAHACVPGGFSLPSDHCLSLIDLRFATQTNACIYAPTEAAACLPLVDERFAALLLHDVFQALSEGVGLALVGRIEAGERRRGLGTADQAKSDGEGGDVSAHGEDCCALRGEVGGGVGVVGVVRGGSARLGLRGWRREGVMLCSG